MAFDLRAVREGMRTALAPMTGGRVYDVLPESAQLPCAAISWPDEIRYHATLSDGVRLDITVTVCVSLTDFAAAQRDLDGLMSTAGLGDLIESYDSDGAWRTAVCRTAGNVRELDVGASALACDFNFEILIS